MYRALSLFSGIGGLCEGAKLAGFEISGAVEMDKYACESYRANFPSIPLYEGDVSGFLVPQSETYSRERQQYVGRPGIDLVFGGPPCQGFSQIGPRDPFDPRNEMYLQLCRIAKDLAPKVILIENVPNMLLMKRGLFKQRIRKALENAGYGNIALMVLSADDFGVPQSRKRVFFIAVQDDFISQTAQSIFESVAASMSTKKVSVNEAILDLPNEVAAENGIFLPYPRLPAAAASVFQKEMRLDMSGKIYSKEGKRSTRELHCKSNKLGNHHTKSVLAKRSKIIRLLRPGAKADSLPRTLWDNKRPEKWRRFDGTKPAHTLLAHMHRDLSEWVHPVYNRWITVREAMRLQSFHDGFVLMSSEWQQLKQVGNAVPPLLGRVPAVAARTILDIGSGKPPPIPLKGQISLI
jgi:DNA (cytosine-5)-methyltransferase 1